ncbi:MAG: hypothetical protein JSV23_04535 [Promethearchaeota archaeon]|nr:MAG: hypothetical protein JSV23_04535 [Candidatus Lokiarchaeota archaeon]
MSYKRNPAIQCWIKHILDGQYSESEKFFYTIFGQVKRIRIIATIIDKKEKLVESNEVDMGIEEDSNQNIRLDFDLDDSTGVIRAIIRNVNPENFIAFDKGDVVDVIGRVSKYGDYVSLWIEILKKVEEPNLILLRNAEIINRIKRGEIQEIPEIVDNGKSIEEFSDEIDVATLFENEGDVFERDDKKEKVYLIIEEYSARGRGINFDKLKQEAKISDSELRSVINDLILESRIYESDKDNFEAF